MKLTFRQGIARHQTDVNGNATFLQRNGGNGNFIDLVVSPEPTVLVFAHKVATYIVEEVKTVPSAWGPISGTPTKYLYWDVNLLNATVTRGITLLPPLYTSDAPLSPAPDQHWFDTIENIFRVWNGSKWIDKVRLFAGYITSGAIIHPYPIGTQAGLHGESEGGNIILDSFGAPLRESDGSFVTSITWLNVANRGTATAQLDAVLRSAMASEELPKYSLVQLQAGGRMGLARSTDYRTHVHGIVTEDLYEGEVATVINTGLVKNPLWAWPSEAVGKPFFCGVTGEVTLTPPTQGVLQQCGFIYDRDAIHMTIHQVVVLDNPDVVPTPPPPPPIQAPLANFSANVLTGVSPLTVQFTDLSTNAVSLEWDFTNDGYVDSVTPNPIYTFATPGSYTVRQRAINTFGQDDEIKSNYIVVTAPNSGVGNVNLGLSFSAPAQVNGGSTFSFQVIVTNDGLGNAVNVLRELALRSNNNSEVTLVSPPPGATVSLVGNVTRVVLPLINIASGGVSSITMQATTTASAKSIQISGIVSSPQNDSTPQDNTATVTIGVKS